MAARRFDEPMALNGEGKDSFGYDVHAIAGEPVITWAEPSGMDSLIFVTTSSDQGHSFGLKKQLMKLPF